MARDAAISRLPIRIGRGSRGHAPSPHHSNDLPTPGLAAPRRAAVERGALGARQAQRQRRARPGAGRERDELVLAVWEAALEVELERLAARDDVPGAVL